MGEPDAVWEQTSLWILLPQTAITISFGDSHTSKLVHCLVHTPSQTQTVWPFFTPSTQTLLGLSLWVIYAFILFLSSLWGRFAKLIIVLEYSIEKLQCTRRPTLNKHTDTLYGSLTVAPDHTFSWIHELPMALPFPELFVCVCVYVCPKVWYTRRRIHSLPFSFTLPWFMRHLPKFLIKKGSPPRAILLR